MLITLETWQNTALETVPGVQRDLDMQIILIPIKLWLYFYVEMLEDETGANL